jgi:hypothetical protein
MLAMPTGRQLRPAAILALVLALGWCAPASAQPYPGKPIRWYGLAAPKGTPRDIVMKLNAETQRIFNDPAFQEKFLAPNFIFSVVSSPEAFAERIRTESAKWGKVIKDANVKVE